jgi:hypothetical protein
VKVIHRVFWPTLVATEDGIRLTLTATVLAIMLACLQSIYLFDWKKINKQLAEKREVCRAYRSRRQAPRSTERTADPFVMVSYDPSTRTVYASDASCPLALLDAVLEMERAHKKSPRQAVTCGGLQTKGHLIGSQLLLTPSAHERNEDNNGNGLLLLWHLPTGQNTVPPISLFKIFNYLDALKRRRGAACRGH